ncbi:MAG: hypothetical protein IJV00_10750 [Clostridia bacterium]|nr:hypothetical protein [Clostridia bacterium]
MKKRFITVAFVFFISLVLLCSCETLQTKKTLTQTKEPGVESVWKDYSEYKIITYDENDKLHRVTKEDVVSAVKEAVNLYGTQICRDLGIDCSVTLTGLGEYSYDVYKYYRGVAQLAGYLLENRTENVLCGMLSDKTEDYYSEKYNLFSSMSGEYSDEFMVDGFYIFADDDAKGYDSIDDYMRDVISLDGDTVDRANKLDHFVIYGSGNIICFENGRHDVLRFS